MLITATQLLAAVPRANVAEWLGPVTDAMSEFEIDTPSRIAAFLAQCGHESADFTRLVENLNYSAEGLAATWPSRYSSTGRAGGKPNALALRLHRKPEAIANNVYADRLGNGNEASGDGWRYRGRGLIQLTGRANVAAASQALNVDYLSNPDWLVIPVNAARSSAWWWHANRVNSVADAGDWLGVSRAVNLGNPRSTATPVGLDDRNARTYAALEALQREA
jgi:putative chitinase